MRNFINRPVGSALEREVLALDQLQAGMIITCTGAIMARITMSAVESPVIETLIAAPPVVLAVGGVALMGYGFKNMISAEAEQEN